jgi:hypothetical protein
MKALQIIFKNYVILGYKMKRRVGAIDEFAFEPLTLIGSRLNCARSVKQLHITIAVTGWINDRLQGTLNVLQ